MATKPSPSFRKFLSSVKNDEVVIPILRTALYKPEFKSFSITLPDFTERRPDGWFHPSTHPLWSERLLYYYLVAPEKLVMEPFDPTSVMAVTQGHFWHSFVQYCLLEVGWLLDDEVSVRDEETGSRGHLDGITRDDEVFEFKTMNRMKASKLPKRNPDDPELIAAFKELNPEYYAQAQEYMRMSGYRKWRGLILSLEYPFDMREILLTFDDVASYKIKEKYMRVRQAVADQRPPDDCCGVPRSAAVKACPARLVCPVGSI